MTSPRVSGVRLDALFQHAREPVFVLNAERRLVYVNRAWEDLTGHPAEAVLGLVCQPHGPTSAGDLAGLGGSFCPPSEALEGQPAGGHTLILHSSGERRWRRVEFWPYHDDDGSVICLFGLVREADAQGQVPDSDSQRLRTDLLEVRHRLHGRFGFDNLVGQGPGHRRLMEQVKAAAATAVTVLIEGDPGTGKRLVARTIHQQSARARSPFIPIDCAALPPETIENELFGRVDNTETPGIRLAEGSSLLLGEVLELPRDLQGRLATALDGRVRLLATTSGDLEAALKADRLRPDLYYALTTLVIRLRPLRERLEDLPLLAQHLLERANLRGGRQRIGFSAEAMEVLTAYDWPGNLRELARVLDAAHGEGADDLIQADDLPAAIKGHLASSYTPPPLQPPVTPLDELLTQLERRLIEQALVRARQNKSRAAELLEISRPRLYRRIKELAIPDESDTGDGTAAPAWRSPTTAAAPETSLESPPEPAQP